MATEDPNQDVSDALSAIHETGEQVREREVQTALSKLDALDEQDRDVVEALAARLVAGVLEAPTRSLLTAAAADPETVETALALFGERAETESTDDRPSEQACPGVARAQD
jgi:glutamyl-tRNA reductase